MDDFITFCEYVFTLLGRLIDLINSNFLLSFSLLIFFVSIVLPVAINALTGDDDNNGGVSY